MRRRHSSALRTVAVVAILIATRRTVLAQTGITNGLEGGPELLLPTGARGLGMAQAVVASGIGAEVIFRNPALIAHGPREVAFNIAQQANGITVADATTSIVWPSVTRKPSTVRVSMPSRFSIWAICGPPPCTTIGLMPTCFNRTTSRAKESPDMPSAMAWPPYLTTKVWPA